MVKEHLTYPQNGERSPLLNKSGHLYVQIVRTICYQYTYSVNQSRADSFQPFVASCLWIHALPKLKSAGASTPRHNLAVSVANSNYRNSQGTLAAGYQNRCQL